MAKFPFEIIPYEEEKAAPPSPPAAGEPGSTPEAPRPGGGFRIIPYEEKESEPPRSWAETGEGLKKTAIAKGAESAAALSTFSPIGSIETFAAKDIPMMARGIGSYLGEKLDVISPQRAEEIRAPGSKEYLPSWLKEQTPLQEKGYTSPVTGLPTWKGVAESVRKGPEEGFPEYAAEAARQARQIPDATYEPKTAGEKILGEAITGGAQGLPGAIRTMVGRVITGAAAGAGAEAGQQYAGEGAENEGFAILVGALGGGLVGSKLANAMLPTAVGRDKIAAALAEDIRKGQTPMSVEDARKALADGTPINIVDIAGPKTLALLGKYGNLTEANQSRAGKFNAYLTERAAESGQRAGERVREVMGVRVLDADELARLNERAAAVDRDRIYGYLRNRPEADAIDSTTFAPKLLNDENYQLALKRAKDNAGRLPESFNIVAPERIPGTPGTEPKILQTPQGLKEQPGIPGVPEREIPGNFAFYQQLDQELSYLIKAAGKDKGLARGYQATQENLRDELDRIFRNAGSDQTYRQAQGAARTTFVAQEAPQAGYDFAGTLLKSTQNPFTRGEVRREFNAMTPENREFVRLGVAARIQDEVESGRIGQVAKKYLENAAFRKDMKHVLGEEKFNQIFGSIVSENLVRQAGQLKFIGERIGPVQAGVLGSTYAVPDILAALVQGQGMSQIAQGSAPGKAVLGFLTAMGIQQGFSAMERRVADKVLPMVLSGDAKDFERVAQLADQYPIVQKLFNRLTTTMSVAITNFEQALERADQRKAQPAPAQASGGRIERRAGGRVSSAEAKADALVRAAETAKKQINKTTEPLLNSDDDHIAKALEVANRHI